MVPKRAHTQFMLTPRDLALLASVEEARYLTTQAIEWLHWPSWSARWQRWHTAQQDQPLKVYKPSSRLYDRLLRMEHHRLLHRIRRPVTVAATQVRRDQDAFALSDRGAHVLAEHAGREFHTLAYHAPRARSTLMLAHQVTVGTVYAALRAKIEATGGLAFADWRGEAQLAKAYDRVQVRVTHSDGSTTTKLLPIQPDGTFRLIHPTGEVRCFVEVDRGRPVTTWREKLWAYHAYTNSPELQKRYGTTTFLLLTITTDDTQRRKLMDATAHILGKPSDRYLFGLDRAIHPTTIGNQWRKIGHMQSTVKHLPGSRTVAGVTAESVEHVLIH